MIVSPGKILTGSPLVRMIDESRKESLVVKPRPMPTSEIARRANRPIFVVLGVIRGARNSSVG